MTSKQIYDYIVIGAGTAGGIIAKELTDDKCTSVLVLEAGTNMMQAQSSGSNPGSGALNADNKLSFNMLTKLEPTIGNRQLRISSGRVIGGSSEHNAMYAVRGSKEYYDELGRQFGEQWSYDSVRPLFKKNETYTGNPDPEYPNERGKYGPIFVRQQIIPQNSITTILAQATHDVLGIDIVEDYNTGVRDCTFNKSQILNKEENGKFVRSSTATGYLNEDIVTQGNEFYPDEYGVDGRNLVILAKTTVDNIIFHRKKGQNIAVGVRYVRDGLSQKAYARKGIVLSAGNFSSVILQRSGIGSSTDLAKAGISTLVESPNVGHNFVTHFIAGMGVRVSTTRLQALIDADPDLPFPLGAFKAYGTEGRRLQIYSSVAPSSVPAAVVVQNGWGYNPNNGLGSNVMGISIYDLVPKSRGTILIAHSDPEAYPSLDLNPLSDPNDNDLNFMIDRYIDVYNIMKRAAALDPAGIYKVVYPDESIFLKPEAEKRSELAKYVRASYGNTAHFGGQCRMGNSIQDGVVDGFLNVFGTKNLKVADLSICPILQDGNNTLPVQITGLNAVRFIKHDPDPYCVSDEELAEHFGVCIE